jgi:RNA polymerase sigma-70 factor (ECF subfamily)
MMQIASRRLTRDLRHRVSESDIVQQTMLTASCRFPLFRGTTDAELTNWLLRILESRLNDAFRQHVVASRRSVALEQHASDQLEDHNDSPSILASTHEDATRLARAILELADPMRDIVTMRYIERQTFDSIATQLQLSVPTVWRHWSRAIEHLRNALRETSRLSHPDDEFRTAKRDNP